MKRPKVEKEVRAESFVLVDAADEVIGEVGPQPKAQAEPPSQETAAPAAREAGKLDLTLDEEKLWDWCGALLAECEYDTWAIDALILLVWNVANQKNHLACRDLADRLTHKLYSETLDCSRRWNAYLSTLPGKSYREDAQGERVN
jgi:hypothetical protein